MYKPFVSLAIVTLFSSCNVTAQEPLIQNVRARNITSLEGIWKYHVQMTGGNLQMNPIQKDKNDHIEYDYEGADDLGIPGVWNSQKEFLKYYEGEIWMKRDFDYNLPKGKRLFVYFGAVNYKSRVYINGQKIGEHKGGYTPFNFEITDKLQEQDDFIVVMADNRRYRDEVPTGNFDWWNYGGIYREIFLVEVPSTFIQDYHIQLAKGELNTIKGWVRLNGSKTQQDITLSIPEMNIKHTVKPDKEGRAEIEINVNEIEHWSPESPTLYDVEISCETDTIAEKIGFRTIETRGTEILLNKKPIFLRGICMHDENPLEIRRTNNHKDSKMLLDWAQELNCNFIRLAHYPHNEYTVRMADELGIMLWAEIPVYWQIRFDNEETLKNAKNQLQEMIDRDRNRASIILWSVANETNPGEARQAFLINLINQAKETDPTRLVSAALKKKKVPKDSYEQACEDPLMEYSDIIGLNEYIGWYPNQGLNGLPEDCQKVTWNIPDDKPLIISEFGGGCLAGFHADSTTRWSEEFQESLYKNTLNMLDKIPNLRGLTPWILVDFRSPKRKNTKYQHFWNRKGLVSNEGKKKKAFFLLQSYYKKKQTENVHSE
jgi:beta-glucuronidase